MNLLDYIIGLLKIAFQSCLSWFSLVMEKTGMLPFYFAGVLVVFGVGFLLSRFGSLNAGASDLAANAIGKAIDSRNRKLAAKSGAWRGYYRQKNKR